MKKLLLLVIALSMTNYEHAAKPGESCNKDSDCVGGFGACVNKESKSKLLKAYNITVKRCI